MAVGKTIIEIPLDTIDVPVELLRKRYDPIIIQELSESIREIGVIEPIIVKEKGQRYELIAGLRRTEASRMAKKTHIPAIIVADDEELNTMMTLHENLFNESINIVDEALYFQYLITKRGKDQRSIATMIGKSEGYVSQRLTMLAWDPDLRVSVEDGTIPFSVAREIASTATKEMRQYFLQHAITGGATVRAVQRWKRDWEETKQPPPAAYEQGDLYPQMNPIELPLGPANEIPEFRSSNVTELPSGQCISCDRQMPWEKIGNVQMCFECSANLRRFKAEQIEKEEKESC